MEIPSTFDGLPVTAIAASAFQNNNKIESVVIPSSVEYIGQYAFENCYNLESIRLLGVNPPQLGESAFDASAFTFQNTRATIYVPKNALYAYRAHDDWYYYLIQIEKWN